MINIVKGFFLTKADHGKRGIIKITIVYYISYEWNIVVNSLTGDAIALVPVDYVTNTLFEYISVNEAPSFIVYKFPPVFFFCT